ncbi:hypothetical protein CXU17_04640 [Akkermansia muciniphila]|nr:hypothetical protein CXU17_04640 [Akkermansia muciniphila]
MTGAQAAVLILTQSVSGQTSDELIGSFYSEERGRVRQIIRLLERRGLLMCQTGEDDPFVFPRTWHPTWDGRIALLEWAAYLGNIRLDGRNTPASTGSLAVIEQEDHHHPTSIC